MVVGGEHGVKEVFLRCGGELHGDDGNEAMEREAVVIKGNGGLSEGEKY